MARDGHGSFALGHRSKKRRNDGHHLLQRRHSLKHRHHLLISSICHPCLIPMLPRLVLPLRCPISTSTSSSLQSRTTLSLRRQHLLSIRAHIHLPLHPLLRRLLLLLLPRLRPRPLSRSRPQLRVQLQLQLRHQRLLHQLQFPLQLQLQHPTLPLPPLPLLPLPLHLSPFRVPFATASRRPLPRRFPRPIPHLTPPTLRRRLLSIGRRKLHGPGKDPRLHNTSRPIHLKRHHPLNRHPSIRNNPHHSLRPRGRSSKRNPSINLSTSNRSNHSRTRTRRTRTRLSTRHHIISLSHPVHPLDPKVMLRRNWPRPLALPRMGRQRLRRSRSARTRLSMTLRPC